MRLPSGDCHPDRHPAVLDCLGDVCGSPLVTATQTDTRRSWTAWATYAAPLWWLPPRQTPGGPGLPGRRMRLPSGDCHPDRHRAVLDCLGDVCGFPLVTATQTDTGRSLTACATYAAPLWWLPPRQTPGGLLLPGRRMRLPSGDCHPDRHPAVLDCLGDVCGSPLVTATQTDTGRSLTAWATYAAPLWWLPPRQTPGGLWLPGRRMRLPSSTCHPDRHPAVLDCLGDVCGSPLVTATQTDLVARAVAVVYEAHAFHLIVYSPLNIPWADIIFCIHCYYVWTMCFSLFKFLFFCPEISF